MNKLALLLIGILTIQHLDAQTNDLGTWQFLNLKYSHDKNWSFFGESQLRSLKLYNDFHYYEIKGGLNYKKAENYMLTLGVGTYQTYSEGGNFTYPKNNNEIRIWPQIVLQQTVGFIKIEQRYRTELRFTSSGYRNRFRYRFGISYLFGENKNDFKPFQINVSNELFLTNKEPFFERNRFVIALNYKTSKSTTFQLGYVNQFDYKINDETGRDFLQVGYFVELFRNKRQGPNYETTND